MRSWKSSSSDPKRTGRLEPPGRAALPERVASSAMSKSSEIKVFKVSISARDDGALEAAYVRFSSGKVKRTEEVIADSLLVDYGVNGALLGMELLAPVRLAELARLVDQPRRTSFRRFVRAAVPARLLSSR
jgi:hypothetical protein